MPDPTILLTGASGVVGSAILECLPSDSVVALTHYRPVAVPAVRGNITRPRLGLSAAEYQNLTTRIDVVIHCAAAVNHTTNRRYLHNVNVCGVEQLLRFAADADARLVHVGTAFVARAGGGTPFDAYAESKAAGETLIRESGVPASIAQLSTVIGDSRTGRIARLQALHYLLGFALSGQLPFLPCEPGTHIDVIPQDIAAAALIALAYAHDTTGTFWITAGDAALPMTRIIDLGSELVAARARTDARTKDFDPTVFRTRLVDPAVCATVMNAVLNRAAPEAEPSVMVRAAQLMTAFNGAETFPTSLGEIPGGPAALTLEMLERALEPTLRYLLDLPEATWTRAS
ncbi:SDR family oxidoreductase [Nocardia sp. NPDC023852]|uniref:SDR family oxidoreductase n=1 Tax=Nocardia sp. NPDC023852 TaxID=3154697 RepID=UPI0033D7A9BE